MVPLGGGDWGGRGGSGFVVVLLRCAGTASSGWCWESEGKSSAVPSVASVSRPRVDLRGMLVGSVSARASLGLTKAPSRDSAEVFVVVVEMVAAAVEDISALFESTASSSAVVSSWGFCFPLAALKTLRGKSATERPILVRSPTSADVTAEMGSVGWSSVLYSFIRNLRFAKCQQYAT